VKQLIGLESVSMYTRL